MMKKKIAASFQNRLLRFSLNSRCRVLRSTSKSPAKIKCTVLPISGFGGYCDRLMPIVRSLGDELNWYKNEGKIATRTDNSPVHWRTSASFD